MSTKPNESAANPAPNVTSLDVLRSLYAELSAPFQLYHKTIVRISWRDGSPDTEETVIHDGEIPPAALDRADYPGAKSVVPVRNFVEYTRGSLYTPVSALGYRSFSYDWALAYKLDCDIARERTGDPMDGAAEYISDVAADDKILKRRNSLKAAKPGGRAPMSNTADLEDRYLNKMKNLTVEERKQIRAFLKKNRKELDAAEFMHENYEPKTTKEAVRISSGPPGTTDEGFLSWLLESSSQIHRSTKKKPDLDELKPESGSGLMVPIRRKRGITSK